MLNCVPTSQGAAERELASAQLGPLSSDVGQFIEMHSPAGRALAGSGADFSWSGTTHTEIPSTYSWSSFLGGEPRCPFETLDAANFLGHLRGLVIGEALLTDLQGSTFAIRDRFPDTSAIAFVLQVVDSGSAWISQGGNSERELDNTVVVFRLPNRDTLIRVSTGARIISLAFPRHYLSSRFLVEESLEALQGFHRDSMAMQLVRKFLVALSNNYTGQRPRTARVFETITALLGMRLDELPADSLPPGAKSGRTRHEAVQMFLEENFTNPELRPALVAKQLDISTRYLHKLLKQNDMSFAEEVTTRRLNFCKAALSDWQLRGRSISEIAFAAGFRELSQFNRHFRAAFGMTPSAARRNFLSSISKANATQKAKDP